MKPRVQNSVTVDYSPRLSDNQHATVQPPYDCGLREHEHREKMCVEKPLWCQSAPTQDKDDHLVYIAIQDNNKQTNPSLALNISLPYLLTPAPPHSPYSHQGGYITAIRPAAHTDPDSPDVRESVFSFLTVTNLERVKFSTLALPLLYMCVKLWRLPALKTSQL